MPPLDLLIAFLVSMATRLTSCLQVITTFTRPAPDSPSTSTLASSSWAFLRLSCMAWACFMSPASCPLLNMEKPFVEWVGKERGSERQHAARNDARIELAHQGLHEGVVLHHFQRALLAGVLPRGVAQRGAVGHRPQLHADV